MIRIASLCTGTDVAFFCTVVFVDLLTDGEIKVQNVFSCEKEDRKRKYIGAYVHSHPWADYGACMFKNVEDVI